MTGYIEIELGGQTRRLKFNNYAMLKLPELGFADLAVDLKEVTTANIVKVLPVISILIYAGIIGQDYIDGNPMSVTQDEVTRWVADDFDFDLIEPIMTCFQESKAYGNLVGKAEQAKSKLNAANKVVPKK